MDQRIIKLLKRLAFLGYCSFEITKIVEEVLGTDDVQTMSFSKRNDIIKHLEMYEQLGLNYLQCYSK